MVTRAIISVRHEDDLLTIVDRLLSLGGKEILLVIPSGARVLASAENFSLIKREADSAGKMVSVQTDDPRGRALAVQAGLYLASGNWEGEARKRRFADILPPPSDRGATAFSDDELGREDLQESEFSVEPQSARESKAREEHEKEKEREKAEIEEPLIFPEAEKVGDREEGEVFKAKSPSKNFLFKKISFSRGAKKIKKPEIQDKRAGKFSYVKTRWVELSAALVALVIIFFVASAVLPSVDVKIHPHQNDVAFVMPLTVSVSGGGENAISGQKISVSDSKEQSASASGTSQISSKAKGVITVYNAYSSSPQTLVATTRFVSQDGKIFRLDKTTVVPGAQIDNGKISPSSIDVDVTADQAGPDYNIGSSDFSIPGFQGTPKYTSFSAKSSSSFSGGSLGNAKVVTDQDVSKAKEGLSDSFAPQLQKKFQDQVLKDLVVLDDAKVEAINITTDVNAGDQADHVTAKAEGQISAIAYNASDLRKAVSEALQKRLPQGSSALEGSLSFDTKVQSRDLDKGAMVLSVDVKAKAVWVVDEAAVKQEVAGKTGAEIRGWIAQQSNFDGASVSFSPFWVDRAPTNLSRIKVEVDTSSDKSIEVQPQ